MATLHSPTHGEVAACAGVSRSTVSRALQNSPLLPPETCARIQALARAMGYRPNPLVSALMATRRRPNARRGVATLAFLTGWPTEHGWQKSATVSAWHTAAVARAEELGFRVEHHWGGDPALPAARLSQVLYTRGIVGVLLAPFPEKVMPELQWERFAAVSFTSGAPTPHLNQVMNHHAQTMWTALERAAAHGYRRIGLALPAGTAEVVRRHWLGALLHHQAQQQARERVAPFVAGDFSARSFSKWVTELRPDIVLTHRGEALGWLRAGGWRVPGEIGFLHLDRSPGKRNCAGVNQRHDLIGAAAVDLVAAQLHRNERGVPEFQKTILVAGEWVDGTTMRGGGSRQRAT